MTLETRFFLSRLGTQHFPMLLSSSPANSAISPSHPSLPIKPPSQHSSTQTTHQHSPQSHNHNRFRIQGKTWSKMARSRGPARSARPAPAPARRPAPPAQQQTRLASTASVPARTAAPPVPATTQAHPPATAAQGQSPGLFGQVIISPSLHPPNRYVVLGGYIY